MKVVVYTTVDCKFSAEEKEFLTSKSIAFEEKKLEDNKDFLTEMLSISNNFAGTPVTEITKDSGEKVVLKGFTKEDFVDALGLPKDVSASDPVEIQQQPVAEASLPAEAIVAPPVMPPLMSEPINNTQQQPIDTTLNSVSPTEIQQLSQSPVTTNVATDQQMTPVIPEAIDLSNIEPPQQQEQEQQQSAMQGSVLPNVPQNTQVNMTTNSNGASNSNDQLNSVLQSLQSQVSTPDNKNAV